MRLRDRVLLAAGDRELPGRIAGATSLAAEPAEVFVRLDVGPVVLASAEQVRDDPADVEVQQLANVITDAWDRGIRYGHMSLARAILDAGYRLHQDGPPHVPPGPRGVQLGPLVGRGEDAGTGPVAPG